MVTEPMVNNMENFWGAKRRIGKKLKDSATKSTPTKKTAMNCASFVGDMVRAARPCARSPATVSAPRAAPAATVAPSRAFCTTCDSCSVCRPLPEISRATCCAAWPFSWRALPAEEAEAATISKLRETFCCKPFACSAHSMDLARSTFSCNDALAESRPRAMLPCTLFTCSAQSTVRARSRPFCACSAAPAACCRTWSAACRAQAAQRGSPPPSSRSPAEPGAPEFSGAVSSCTWGPCSRAAAARARRARAPSALCQEPPLASPLLPPGEASRPLAAPVSFAPVGAGKKDEVRFCAIAACAPWQPARGRGEVGPCESRPCAVAT
mmetsp:Transcript_3784/g.10481  ORF Transcript_3784/g.10481 Transcript_3784/m.10481 type:complete len:324 (-) Transcript_3784:3-974(-)